MHCKKVYLAIQSDALSELFVYFQKQNELRYLYLYSLVDFQHSKFKPISNCALNLCMVNTLMALGKVIFCFAFMDLQDNDLLVS